MGDAEMGTAAPQRKRIVLDGQTLEAHPMQTVLSYEPVFCPQWLEMDCETNLPASVHLRGLAF